MANSFYVTASTLGALNEGLGPPMTVRDALKKMAAEFEVAPKDIAGPLAVFLSDVGEEELSRKVEACLE